MTRVALVGVGTMGLPLGRRLLAAGHELVACDLDQARAELLGADVAATPAEAFATAEVAITSLPSVRAVETVVLGPSGLASAGRPGSTLIEMSTSSPELARRLASALEKHEVDVLDAPVSGGPRGAEAGTLAIMVGGRADVLARHRGLLECFGSPVHVGGHGAGQTLKLCNNLLAGCAMAALAEACALAEREGLDPRIVYDVFASSTGDSRVLRTRFPLADVDPLHPASNGYAPLFSLDLLVKDLELVLALGDGDEVATPVARASLGAYGEAQRAGHGDLDYSAVFLTTRSRRSLAQAGAARFAGRFAEQPLRDLGEAALAACGASKAAATAVVDCLLEADRRGIHTHGLLRLPAYCAQARSGEIAAAAEPVLLHEDGPTALVDGRHAFGAVSGSFAVDDAVRRAREHGVGVTSVRNGTHFGAASRYSLRAARAGLVGIAATNTPAAMAPWGGARSRLGNNPVSIAAPMREGAPFVLDIALSAAARGRVKLAELGGERLPEGWALDAGGRPTTDPAAALAGALLPAGGHKGSGLAVAVELLTGALAGAGISPRLVNTGLTGADAPPGATDRGVGYVFVVLDPERFGGRDLFLSRAAELAGDLKSTELAPGVDELLLPGEPEHRAEQLAEAAGIELPAATVAALEALAEREGLSFPARSGAAG